MNPDSDRWVSSDEARTKFRDLMDEIVRHESHVYVMRYGKPTAVIVPVEWYEQVKALTSRRPWGSTLSDETTEGN